MGRAMPLYGHICRLSIKHLLWIVPEANQPVQAPGGRKYMKLYVEYTRRSPKSMMIVYLAIYDNLKIDQKHFRKAHR